jgi:biotin carboxylase
MMNLLVTNTHHSQAYAIIRALRPHADKIVVTMYGENRLKAMFANAASSRLVDKRYYVPSPVDDWRAGNIKSENTEREEAYIQAVVRICEKEKIDTIFPSFDAHVYVFSKNKERFARMGVLIPVPDYETVVVPLDKYRTVQAAQEVGFPCPQTYLPENEEDLKQIKGKWQFPLVIRPRFSSGAQGIEIVSDFGELVAKTRLVRATWGTPIVQEYIPGSNTNRDNFRLVIDKNGELIACFSTKVSRAVVRARRNWVSAFELKTPGPYLTQAVRLLQKLAWWGSATVSTKVDPRDGIPKLTEINCRFGSRLWHATELGINLPLMCLKIARGEKVEKINGDLQGIQLLDPIADLFQVCFWLFDFPLYKLRTCLLGMTPVDPLKAPMSPTQMIHSYRDSYFTNKQKVFSPHFRHLHRDPIVSFLVCLRYGKDFFDHARELGK